MRRSRTRSGIIEIAHGTKCDPMNGSAHICRTSSGARRDENHHLDSLNPVTDIVFKQSNIRSTSVATGEE
jgi:hypothetical protein